MDSAGTHSTTTTAEEKAAKVLRVYFIRHAESTNNTLADEIMGSHGCRHTHPKRGEFEQRRSHDPDLSPLGAAQTDIVAARIAKEAGTAATTVFCSYQLRALKTMAAIHKQMPHLRAVVKKDLHEIGGCYRSLVTGGEEGLSGLTAGDVRRLFPAYVLAEEDGDSTEAGWWRPERGRETRDEAVARARGLLDWLQKRTSSLPDEEASAAAGESIIIVTHGDFFRNVLWLLDERTSGSSSCDVTASDASTVAAAAVPPPGTSVKNTSISLIEFFGGLGGGGGGAAGTIPSSSSLWMAAPGKEGGAVVKLRGCAHHLTAADHHLPTPTSSA